MAAIGRRFCTAVRLGYEFGSVLVPSRFTGAVVFISPPSSQESIIEDVPKRLSEETTFHSPKSAEKTKRVSAPVVIVNSPKSKANPLIVESDAKRDEVFEQLDEEILSELTKNNHKEVQSLIHKSKHLSEETLTKLFEFYSEKGLVERVLFLQQYSKTEYPKFHSQNCQFLHYVAKAYCICGNAESGLSVLSSAYRENSSHRNIYRMAFKDLIVDSVENRSTASLVIFKSHVVRWTEDYKESYPLVCLWYICWASSWFADQMLAEELVDSQRPLRIIIEDRATTFTVTSLANTGNDDATIRLLQTLLRHNMMEAYSKVLETLFEFRVKKRDVQGCTEIMRNAKVLGLSLSKRVEEKYILLVINRDIPRPEPKTPSVGKFNFKF